VISKQLTFGPTITSKLELTLLIKYKGLHHVSLSVTNLERAKDFYSNILCLKEIERPNFDFPGAWYEVEQQQIHLIVLPSSQTIRPEKIKQ
jgi:catechol-2,3-dioxygenase